jgi:hypothetical protein
MRMVGAAAWAWACPADRRARAGASSAAVRSVPTVDVDSECSYVQVDGRREEGPSCQVVIAHMS